MYKDFMYRELSHIIIGASFKVHSALGSYLPEHCYQHALAIHLTDLGYYVTEQEEFKVHYNGEHVGRFFTDIIVDRKIILELKSDEKITPNHESQLFTYLRTSGLHVGYILNFGRKSLAFKRLIL